MMLFFPKRDDDNTTQGKLAYGCMVMIWLVISLAIFIAIAQTFTCWLTGYCEGFSS